MSGFRTAHSVKVNSSGQPENDITKIGGSALALGQAAAGACIPVVLPDAEVKIDATKVGGTALAFGQAAASASIPVVLASGTDVGVNLGKVGGAAFDLGQENMAGSLPVAIASDQGALSVSMTNAATSGTRGNLENNQSVANNDTSSEVDVSLARNCVIFGVGSSLTDPIQIQVSADGTNWCNLDGQIYPQSGNFYVRHSGIAWKEVRVKWGGTATGVYATVLYN